MSKFRSIVENIMAQHLKEDWETDLDYKKANPDDYRQDGEYQDWLDDKAEEGDYYTKYAIYVRTTEKYGNEFACKEIGDFDSISNGWGEDNELKNTPDLLELWDTEEEAAKAMVEYQNAMSNAEPGIQREPKVVPVYSDTEDGIYYMNLEEIYSMDKWNEEKYGY